MSLLDSACEWLVARLKGIRVGPGGLIIEIGESLKVGEEEEVAPFGVVHHLQDLLVVGAVLLEDVFLSKVDELVVEQADEGVIELSELHHYFCNSEGVQELELVNGLGGLPLVPGPKEPLHKPLHPLTELVTILVLVLNALQPPVYLLLVLLLEHAVGVDTVDQKVVNDPHCPHIHLERVGRREQLGGHEAVSAHEF